MKTFIYVIAADENGPIKIGISQNPEKRLRQLQTGHERRLILFHVQEFEPERAHLIERIIHNTVRHKRKIGEWFDLTVVEAIGEVDFAVIRYEEHADLRQFLR